MEKNKILDIIAKHEDCYPQIIKAHHRSFYDKITTNYPGKKFGEKIYRWVYKENSEIGNCQVCKKSTKFISIKVGFQKFCSKKCSNIITGKLRSDRAKDSPKNPKFWIEKECNICHKDFMSLKKRNQRFCSGKCSSLFTANDSVRLEKIKKTKLKKYGSETYVNPEKAKKTCLEKYGVANFSNTLEFKEFSCKNAKKRFLDNLNNHKLNKTVIPLFTKEEYVDTNKANKYNFQCKSCNAIFEDHIDGGHIPRCLICNPYIQGYSLREKEILSYIREILPNVNIIEKDRSILENLELDIYIPSKKLAIEFNGLYWHSEIEGGKNKKYHLDKTVGCLKKGIQLIHIFEDEWLHKEEIVKRRLKHIFGLNTEKIYARNCGIRTLSPKESKEFLEKTHLQGSINSSIRIGLCYENKIVSVMTFGKNRISLGNKPLNNLYELYRFSSNKNVVGGASKMLAYFIKTYKPKTIVSYADRRWSAGNLYEKLGFNKLSETTPNYYYINVKKGSDVRCHRYGFAKHLLKTKLPIFDSSLSEWENMQVNGWDRIWDCGSIKYQLTL